MWDSTWNCIRVEINLTQRRAWNHVIGTRCFIKDSDSALAASVRTEPGRSDVTSNTDSVVFKGGKSFRVRKEKMTSVASLTNQLFLEISAISISAALRNIILCSLTHSPVTGLCHMHHFRLKSYYFPAPCRSKLHWLAASKSIGFNYIYPALLCFALLSINSSTWLKLNCN